MKNKLNILGVMSGSSLDGIDLAWISFSNIEQQPKRPSIDWLHTAHHPYSAYWSDQLKTLDKSNAPELLEMHVKYAEYQAAVIEEHFKKAPKIDLIGWHGHTIFHEPQKGFSFQLGRGDVLCAKLQTPTINDFRNQNITAGGQGAPLATIVDNAYFTSYSHLLNLGGIANLTINEKQPIAFDLCGFNQVLNYLAAQLGETMDRDGNISGQGALNENLKNELNKWDYLQKRAPKSLSNQEVQSFYIPILEKSKCSIADKMNTFIHHVGDTILSKIAQHQQPKILLSGGGAYNRTFTDLLKSKVEGIVKVAKQPWTDYKEAFLMAYMAYLRWTGQPNILSSASGGTKDQSAGLIHLP